MVYINDNSQNILVIRYGTIGDTIFASAFYRELRKALPTAKIDVLVDSIAGSIMEQCPYVNQIHYIKGKHSNFLNYINLFKNYDTVYFLKNDSFFSLVAFFARVKHRIGFKLARNKFLTTKVQYNEDRHEIDCYLDLLRACNIPVENTDTELWLNEKDKSKINAILNGIKNKKILIQAYSRFNQKNWIDKYWIEIIKYLSDELDMQVFYSGGNKDINSYNNLTSQIPSLKNPPINTCGDLSITETMELVSNMDMVIGIDSGVIHMAAALNIPSILIHGATSLLRWMPRSNNCIVVSKYFPCSPCCLQSHTKKYCKNKTSKCMLKLTPTYIINVLKNQFNNSIKNTDSPKISVIIPVYNVEKYIAKCLDSIINQSFEDIEIICINDGSTDYSSKILDQYSKRDSRIKVINIEHQGVSVVRNTGIALARGEYISFIDADDWISPNFYELMYNEAKKENADIAVSGIMRVHKHYRMTVLRYTKKTVSESYIKKLELCDVPDHSYVWNKIYKRESLLNTGIVFKAGVIYEDIIFTAKILYHMKKLITVPNVKYYYFRHKNTLVKLNNNKSKEDFEGAKKEIREFFKQQNIDITSIETQVKKYKICGVTLFKTRKKGCETEHKLFNFVRW
ncbi:glycosyltransferase [bacterium]|nr:glycosyltransferase [bacterium]